MLEIQLIYSRSPREDLFLLKSKLKMVEQKRLLSLTGLLSLTLLFSCLKMSFYQAPDSVSFLLLLFSKRNL